MAFAYFYQAAVILLETYTTGAADILFNANAGFSPSLVLGDQNGSKTQMTAYQVGMAFGSAWDFVLISGHQATP